MIGQTICGSFSNMHIYTYSELIFLCEFNHQVHWVIRLTFYDNFLKSMCLYVSTIIFQHNFNYDGDYVIQRSKLPQYITWV